MPKCTFFWYDQSKNLWGLKCGAKYYVWDDGVGRYIQGMSPAQYKATLKTLERLKKSDPGGNVTL